MSAHDRHIGHRQHSTKADLQDLLEPCGFQVRGTWEAGLPFFNLYGLLVLVTGKLAVEETSRLAGSFSLSRLVANGVFEVLFPLSCLRWRWVWQRVALATAGPGRPPGT